MEISVILGTYNRAASLQATLETFSALVIPSGFAWELLVVDNNSTDHTREVVQKFAEASSFRVRYIFEKRQGRSSALNAGITAAQGEIVAFTDDDVLLHCDWLSNLKRTFDDFDCAGFAGRVVPLWNQSKPDWLEIEGQLAVVNFDLGEESKEIKIPPLGANSAFRRGVFDKYGPFRLDLGVGGGKHTITCEDTEFGERLIRGGEKIVYGPGAIIYHPVDPKRTTKRYFVSWYYYNGVSMTRTAGLPKDGVFWFGVPRWLYRELLLNVAKWVFTMRGTDRFQHKLRMVRTIGTIVESYRLSSTKRVGHVLREPQQM